MANSGWPNPNPPPRSNGRGLILPILFIVVGSVLLLNNLGVLPWSIWSTLAQLWPVVLILLGVELVLGRRTSIPGALVALVVIVAIVGWADHRAPARPASAVAQTSQPLAAALVGPAATTDSASHLAVPLGDTQNARITLNLGAGDLSIGALPVGDPNLATADATLPEGTELTKTTSTHDGETDLTLAAKGRNGFFWPFAHPDQRADSLAVALAPKVPLDLQTNLGVGQSNLDLRGLAIQSLDVNSGAGQMTVQFPSGSGQTRANINSGAGGRTTLIIPSNVGAYVHTAGGLVSVQLPPGRYTQVADGYESDNYATATDQIDIYLHVGVGQVDVQ